MTVHPSAQLCVTRIVAAPRRRVFHAFSDPEEFAAWWGPNGNALHDVVLDVRTGGSMRWSEVFVDDPDLWTNGTIELTEVVDGELLDGVMRISGTLPGGNEPFETRMRIAFNDEGDAATRLEITQWLPETHVAPTTNGWDESLSKLDRVLAP